MRRRWALFLLFLASAPAKAITYHELQTMIQGGWCHVPAPVGEARFNRDQARCRLVAVQIPVTSTTPAVVEMVRWAAEINCLEALGYEPVEAWSTKNNR